jgi:succinate dehydrogenase/fumarate reductase flavoprotein subunit
MQTSVPGVFAAGETSGVAGAIVAADEGRMAGVAAARYLGLIRPEVAADHAARIRKRLDRLYLFRSTIDALYAVGPGLSELITPETVVCRCEEVLGAAVEKAVAEGACSLRDVKMTTRAGMGYCQGRMCATSISHSLARRCGVGVEHAGFSVARPPVRPVPLGAMV